MNNPAVDHQGVLLTQAIPLDWIAAVLSPRFGDVQHVETVKLRPWSQVYRIIAERGTNYFKICGPDAQHEVTLLAWLLSEYSAIAPEIIALSPEQGWILMADAGTPWRDLPQPAVHQQSLQILLSRYAQLQQHSLNHIDTLLAMPPPDRRLEWLPQLLRDLIATGDANGRFDTELPTQVLDTLPTLEKLSQSLSASPYAAALNHGDLHTGNVLFKRDRLSICDWGDACVTHPFCSLLPLVETVIGNRFSSVGELVNSDLIQAYLQTWESFASSHVLKVEMQQALCLGLVLRAIDIAYMLKSADAESVKRWSPHVSKFLVRWVHLAATIPQTILE
ncbi:MAG: aminoglycoside phosphotransferase family protein [Leptolyngbya sp. SIO1D8]|nr:aminoglycoside phosphotransferase family protein [Leptolyngbya sp. SIO1D8]